MLLVLCLIALFLNVGAQAPTQATDNTEVLIGLLDKISGVFLEKMEYLKEMLANRSSTDEPKSQEYPERSAQSSSQTSRSDGYTTESTTGATTPSYAKSSTETTRENVTPEQDESHENMYTSLIGSIRGVQGFHFPDYTDIPVTSFSCSSKAYVPGFYADLETGCQVFHVCWPHRRESFLCPIGTTFNQAILACDFWYSSNCSLASYYYNVNAQSHLGTHGKGSKTMSMVDFLLGKDDKIESALPTGDLSKLKRANLSYILKFLPVKAKIIVYPETADIRSKIIAEASIGKEKSEEIKTVRKPSPPTPVLDKQTSPELQHKLALASAKEKADYARHGLSSAVSIVHEVLDFVGSILRETEGIYRAINTKKSQPQTVHKPVGTQQRRPLTKVNPRFITKPVAVPKTDISHEKPPVIASKDKVLKVQVDTKHAEVGKATQTSDKVHFVSESRDLSISKSTKTALVKNYLKLFHMRRG